AFNSSGDECRTWIFPRKSEDGTDGHFSSSRTNCPHCFFINCSVYRHQSVSRFDYVSGQFCNVRGVCRCVGFLLCITTRMEKKTYINKKRKESTKKNTTLRNDES